MKKHPFILFLLCFSLLLGGCRSASGSEESSSDSESGTSAETTSTAASLTTTATAATAKTITPPTAAPLQESSNNIQSSFEVSLYGNGLLIPSRYILVNNTYYLPTADIAKSIGCQYSFDDKKNILTFSGNGTKITMVLGSETAEVNRVDFDGPGPIVKDKVVYAPINFVCNHFACKVDVKIYQESYASDNSIYVYSPIASDLGGHLGSIKSDVERKSFGSVSQGSDDLYFNGIDYDLSLPQFTGLRNKALQNKLNSLFTKMRDDSVDDVTYASKGPDYSPLGYLDTKEYYIKDNRDGVLSLTVYDDLYGGGAHSNQEMTAYMIDFNAGKILSLSDLFQPSSDYKTRLLSEIKTVWNGGTGDYQYVDLPDSLDKENFYFENGNLVFYYNPYDLAGPGRGFVYFKIPLKNISDILKSSYKNL